MFLIFLFNIFIAVLATDPPQWDSVHTVKGVLHIPYAEIEEPFEAWFDKSIGQSRIDYYGIVKTYQSSREAAFGISLKVAPITTAKELNKITCLRVNGTRHHQIRTQTVLPVLQGFKFADIEDLLGYKCEKFVFEETFGQKTTKYSMWIRYVQSQNRRQPIPVRYEVRGWDNLLGAHYDHYHLDYNFYSPNAIPEHIFEVKEGKPCVGFPGPGYDHYATFNPMKEFVHPIDSTHVDIEHARFIARHDIIYATSEEQMYRRSIFLQNLRFIHSKNRENLGFKLAVNHLADLTKDELHALQGRKSTGRKSNGMEFPYDLNDYPESDFPNDYDWRLFGAVTPVKDQAVCGSCWSFGATGSIEGALFIQNGGNLIHLSQQALIDCSWEFGNDGCNGGQEFRAYEWIMKKRGIPTDESYGSYKGQDGLCHVDDANVTLVAPITGWIQVQPGSSHAMKLALLKHGPINVAIDASHSSFHFYSHGIYSEPKCGDKDYHLTHYVLVVGFGRMHNEEYWLVKNSFSNLWGNDGYILMSAKENNCGILNDATYVTF